LGKHHKVNTNAAKTDGEGSPPPGQAMGASRWHWPARLGMCVLVATVYGLTLHPGVSRGDSAELQYASATLGVCHSPGYQVEVHFGKLFSLLPVGDVAWRVNLMMVVFGVLGCLVLYDTVQRITGRLLPAWVAATTLAFSSAYWSHAIVAEVYVFYGAFLLAGVWAATRFVFTNKAAWLYVMSLVLGVCCWDRPSEFFVLPGFLAMWLAFRGRVKLGALRLAVAAALFLAPLAFSVSSYLVHFAPQRLPNRDDALRDEILSRPRGDPRFASMGTLPRALCYCLGLGWADQGLPAERAWTDLERYGFHLSGAGAFDDIGQLDKRTTNIEQGCGTSLGCLGFFLAVWGSILWRRQYGWVLLGWGLFAGNLAFYLWNSRWDGLTFIVPGMAGLSLLAGLGAAWLPRTAGARRRVFQAACLAVPLFLLATNYPFLDRSTSDEHHRQEMLRDVAATPLTRESAFLLTYWPAMTFRALLHVETSRPDIHVFRLDKTEDFHPVLDYCRKKGWAAFLPVTYFGPSPEVRAAAARTPKALREIGLIQVASPP